VIQKFSHGHGRYLAGKNNITLPDAPRDKAVFADWSGDGETKVGTFRNGFSILDFNGNRALMRLVFPEFHV